MGIEASSRALVIDDDPGVRKVVVGFLRTRGIDVAAAENGDEGLKLARANGFNLVITDYEMPGTMGEPLLRQLKQELPDVKVMVISGSGLTERQKEGLATAGMDGFLDKPFTADELTEAVERFL